MKSKTLSFNATLLKKDITRFAPVWGLYTVFLLILFMTSYTPDRIYFARDVLDIISGMALINLIYGGICANVLFGDLFNSRMCYALHAMPMRREHWFCTHTAAGLLFCLIPNIAGSVLLMALLQEYFYVALLWLVVSVLEFLFFFGAGIFSTLCAGNRLGMLAVYAIINFFSLLVFLLADQLYIPLLYGLDHNADWYKFFSPVYHLASEDFVSLDYNITHTQCWINTVYWNQWIYLFTVALMGIGLMTASVFLYRKRKLESAGDFLALRKLEPVFWVIYTLACGVFLHALSYIFGIASNYFLMVVGIAVGAFTGKMLLERTVKVFRKKNVLQFGILLAALIVSLVVTKLDPAGITWYQPEAGEIAAMRVYDPSYYSEYGKSDQDCWQLESQEEIETFRQVHSQLMSERDTKSGSVSQVEILYILTDGSTVTRYYDMDEHSAAFNTVNAHLSNWRYLFRGADYPSVAKSVNSITINLYGDLPQAFAFQDITDPEKISQFMEALKLDCEAGHMTQGYIFHTGEEDFGWVSIDYSPESYSETPYLNPDHAYITLSLYPCATHTRALMDQWLEEYEN